MDDVKGNVVRKDDFKRLAPQFEVFFHVFISRHAIQEQKQRDKMAKLASQPESTPSSSTSTITGTKSPPQSPISLPGKDRDRHSTLSHQSLNQKHLTSRPTQQTRP